MTRLFEKKSYYISKIYDPRTDSVLKISTDLHSFIYNGRTHRKHEKLFQGNGIYYYKVYHLFNVL